MMTDFDRSDQRHDVGGFRGLRSLEREHGAERRLSLPQRRCAKTTPKRCGGGCSVGFVVVVVAVVVAVVVVVVAVVIIVVACVVLVVVVANLKLSLP